MSTRPFETNGQKFTFWALRGFGVLFCLFLIGPIFVFVPLSFNDLALFHYPIETYSLRWYRELIGSLEWRRALINSVVVATASTLLATALGVSAAVGLWKARFPGKNVLMVIFLTPMIVPSVIAGVSMYLALVQVGLDNSYTGLIFAHTALASPMVVVTVSATLARFDATLLRAAGSLGAGPLTAFRRVTFPLILPGIVTGAIFAFAISFDDVIAALFIAGPSQRTLPVQMYSRATDLFELTIAAAATVMLVIAVLLMTALEFLKRRERLPPTANGSR